MSPEERVAAYDEAVQILNNYTAQEAAKIGNSQASLGLMAERVARPSGVTSGLANYTYNRTLRPTVDTLAANLTTSGRSQALEKQLYDALTAAKNRYEDARNRYTVSSSAATNNNSGGGTGLTNKIVGNTTDSGATQKPYPPAGTITGIGSENGVYRIIVADGKGGFNQYQYSAGSQDEALRKFYAGEGRVYIPDSGSNGGGIAGGGGGGGGGRVR